MDQQQQQQVLTQGEMSEEAVEEATSNDNCTVNNCIRGSLGSLRGPRVAAGEMLYEGHGNTFGIFIRLLR